MSSSKKKQPFELEGRFLGFAGKQKGKPKFLRLSTAHGEQKIKLRKPLRKRLPETLTPGEWIRISGKQKAKKHTVERKAKLVTLASPNTHVQWLHDMPADSTQHETEAAEPCTQCQPQSETQTELQAEIQAETAPVSPAPPVAGKPGRILVCRKSKCCKQGGKKLTQALETALRDRGLDGEVVVKGTGCMKRCKAGPNLMMMPDKKRYSRVTAKDAEQLIDHHFAIAPQLS